jgi:hypothetical protein
MCRATGISVPAAAFTSTSASVQQIVELANQEGRALSRRHDWQELTLEGSFTTLAAESQGTLASIIGVTQQLWKIVNDTIWNRTTQQQICGPLSRKNWQGQKALSLTGPYPQYRVRGNTLLFYPSPPAGQSCFFEYISGSWATNQAGSTFKKQITLQTDIILLDGECVIAGLEWRWLRKKGLSYAEEFASYEELVKNEIGNNATKAVLSMDGVARGPRPGVIVPIGSWNLP